MTGGRLCKGVLLLSFCVVLPWCIWHKTLVKIFVMRHGPAEDTSLSGSDLERDLTVPGRERVRAVAQALAAQNELPLRIFSSPLVRCLQTAELVANRAGNDVMVSTRRELAPGGNVLNLVNELRTAALRRVLLVGHEPDVSVLLSSLGIPMQRGFMKAMVVGLSIADESEGPRTPGRLRFVLDPKTLVFERAAT